jgi:hypothetical protein
MIPNLAKSGLLLGGVVAASLAAAAGLAAGCGGGSSSGPPSEAGVPDSTTDTANDVPTVDTGTDTGMEQDAADSGAGDAVADVQYDVPEVSNFPRQVTEAFCRRLQACCMVPDTMWNQEGATGCVTSLEAPGVGGFWNLSAFSTALGTRNVQYDQASASACLSAVMGFTCGTVPSTYVDQTVATCYAALRGVQDAGAPCDNSLECGPGNYCTNGTPLGDGSATGICVPLRMVTQSCRDPVNSLDCNYRGTPSPTAYCMSIEGGTAGECVDALGADGGCTLDPQCQSNVCNGTNCTTVYVFSDQGTPNGICTFFVSPDGG